MSVFYSLVNTSLIESVSHFSAITSLGKVWTNFSRRETLKNVMLHHFGPLTVLKPSHHQSAHPDFYVCKASLPLAGIRKGPKCGFHPSPFSATTSVLFLCFFFCMCSDSICIKVVKCSVTCICSVV